MTDYEAQYEDEYYNEYGSLYRNLHRISTFMNIFLQVVTIIANIFHLIVLFHKDLRRGAIYILMIGIALSDVLSFIGDFYNAGIERGWWILHFQTITYCVKMEYAVINPFPQAVNLLIQLTRPGSIWLAVFMALIRTLSVMFPMNNWIQSLTKPRKAVWMVVGVFGFWTVFYSRILYYVRIAWLPDIIDEDCFLSNKKVTEYVLVTSHEKYVEYFNDATSKIFVRVIPTIFYPILTLALLIQLRTIKKKRADMNKNSLSDRSDKTTKLILVMTMCFMLSEGPDGIITYLIEKSHNSIDLNEATMEEMNDYMKYVTYLGLLHYLSQNLRFFNALTHPFLCFFMSSQYRDTVKGMFCIKTKKKLTVIKVSTASVASLKSLSDQGSRKSKTN